MRKNVRVSGTAIRLISRMMQSTTQKMGTQGNNGVLNGRCTSGLVTRRYITVMHTIPNAARDPTLVTSDRMLRDMQPAAAAATKPTISVLIHGVRNLGWTLARTGGSRPSRLMV